MRRSTRRYGPLLLEEPKDLLAAWRLRCIPRMLSTSAATCFTRTPTASILTTGTFISTPTSSSTRRRPVIFFAELDAPVATNDIIPYQEFLETRFYLEWARPQGLVDHVCAVIEKSNTSAALFGVFRHERDGLVDDDVRRRLITPHVRRAVLIGKVIDLRTAEAATFADTLDGLTAGMQKFHVSVSCRYLLVCANNL